MKNSSFIHIAAFAFLIFSGCSSNPYAKTNRYHKKQTREYAQELSHFPQRHSDDSLLNYGPYPVGTTNFSLRKPNFVVLHHTAQNSVGHTLKTFTLPRTSVSSHYVISRDGEIYQMLNDYYRGWHAGTGKWGNDTDLNSSSIGIELDNNGYEPFADAQIESLLALLKVLKERHKIPTANFIGHSDLAPSRKVDPNPTFPWQRLAEEGYGFWYEETATSVPVENELLDVDKKILATGMEESGATSDSTYLDLDPKLALRIIGYDVSDLDAAIKAFKLHFIQNDISSELSDEDRKILFKLYQKYL